jgi:hypothetical protein
MNTYNEVLIKYVVFLVFRFFIHQKSGQFMRKNLNYFKKKTQVIDFQTD